MPPLTEKELSEFPELKGDDIIVNHVARYLDLYSLSSETSCKVIGEKGKIYDKPGFEVEFISDKSKNKCGIYTKDVVFMPVDGYWRIKSEMFDIILNPGDTFSLPKNNKYTLEPTKPGIASIYKVIPTDDNPGSTQRK